MSGIAGIIRFDGAPVEPGLVERLTSGMAHRGPDGIRHWVNGSVALGQCMLRTTPESLEETQPLANEDESLMLVMDGRVDNWEELRTELLGRGVILRNRSDAELVLRSYETWGTDCLTHIDGDFALVIWDARQRTAFCARDRMGNKPFNYHWDGKTLAFASDIQALLTLPWVPQEPNEGLVAEYLATEWYSRDETLWVDVRRLVAGHSMLLRGGDPCPKPYWQPELHTTIAGRSGGDYVAAYRALLIDTVRRMSRSHSPISFEVSGGLDSSALLAMGERLRRGNKLLAPGLLAFTLDFRDDPDANELAYARRVGEHLALDVNVVQPTQRPAWWYREEASRRREFPGFPNGEMGWSIKSAARHAGSKALLCGFGGDQWLSGGRSYYEEALAAMDWRRVARHIERDSKDAGTTDALVWLVRHGLVPLLPGVVRGVVRSTLSIWRGRGYERRAWLTSRMRELVSRRALQGMHDGPTEVARPGQRELLLELSAGLNALAVEQEERRAADAGVELRRPFWTSAMAQFALSTPAEWFLSGNTDKFIHRRALALDLPIEVLNRHSKADFTVVFRTPLAEAATDLTERIPSARPGWVSKEQAVAVFNQARRRAFDGRPDWQLWSLLGCDAVFSVRELTSTGAPQPA